METDPLYGKIVKNVRKLVCVISHHTHKLITFGKWLPEVVENTFGSVCAKFGKNIILHCWENRAADLLKEPKNTLLEKTPFKVKKSVLFFTQLWPISC